MGYAWFVVLVLILTIAMVFVQTKQKGPYDLPKVVWTHWDSDTPPEDIKQTVERMRRMLEENPN